MLRTPIVTVLAIVTTTLATLPAADADAAERRPCRYEDSRNCVWDHRHMGDGAGRSFLVKRNGWVVYITHKRAHRLLGL